jgi:hypothetical protein
LVEGSWVVTRPVLPSAHGWPGAVDASDVEVSGEVHGLDHSCASGCRGEGGGVEEGLQLIRR